MRTRTRNSDVLLWDELFLDPKSHVPESSIRVWGCSYRWQALRKRGAWRPDAVLQHALVDAGRKGQKTKAGSCARVRYTRGGRARGKGRKALQTFEHAHCGRSRLLPEAADRALDGVPAFPPRTPRV